MAYMFPLGEERAGPMSGVLGGINLQGESCGD